MRNVCYPGFCKPNPTKPAIDQPIPLRNAFWVYFLHSIILFYLLGVESQNLRRFIKNRYLLIKWLYCIEFIGPHDTRNSIFSQVFRVFVVLYSSAIPLIIENSNEFFIFDFWKFIGNNFLSFLELSNPLRRGQPERGIRFILRDEF